MAACRRLDPHLADRQARRAPPPRPPNSPSRSNGAAQNKDFAAGGAADRVAGDDRPDPIAFRGHRARRAETALEVEGRRAIACSGRAEGEAGAGRGGCGEAHLPIGRHSSPGLGAAVEGIEQARPRNDRHPPLRRRIAASDRGEVSHRAARRIEAEGRAARKDEAVDALDRHVRLKQFGVAGCGRAAMDGDRGDGRRVEDHRRDAGGEPRVVGRSDPHAGDVGDEVCGHRCGPAAPACLRGGILACGARRFAPRRDFSGFA